MTPDAAVARLARMSAALRMSASTPALTQQLHNAAVAAGRQVARRSPRTSVRALRTPRGARLVLSGPGARNMAPAARRAVSDQIAGVRREIATELGAQVTRALR